MSVHASKEAVFPPVGVAIPPQRRDPAQAVDARTLDLVRQREHRLPRRGWLVRRALLASDVVGLVAAYLIAEAVAGRFATGKNELAPSRELWLFLGTLPVWVLVAKLYGLYDRDEERTDHSTTDDIGGVFHLVTVGTWGVFAGTSLLNIATPSLLKLVVFWASAVLLVTTTRSVARAICRRQLAYLQNTIIVGAGTVGQLVARKFLQHPEYGINLVGFVDDHPKERRGDLEHLTLLGGPSELEALIRQFDVERVVVAFSNDTHEQQLDLIRMLAERDVQVDIVPRLFEIVGSGVDLHSVEGVPLVGLRSPQLSRSSLLIKRSVDLVLTIIGLIVLAPFFAIVALAIKLDSPGAVFFRQTRMGSGEQTFEIFKFRTMVADAEYRKPELIHLNMNAVEGGDPRMFKIPNDPRVTRVGSFLRRFSLDELPQLLNVVRGEMSLVGPRPLILSEDQCVQDWARRRLNVKPGITGLWQVLGRNYIPFEEMTKLDYLYVTSWSLWGDLLLIFRTMPVLFGQRGGM